MNARHRLLRTSIVPVGSAALVALVALGLSGCDLIKVPGSDIVTDETRLPESNSSLLSTEVAADRVTYTYASPPQAEELEAGQVIVGQEGGGYLRKVRNVQVSGNTLVALTDDAVLTDAIANQHISATINPGSGSGSASSSGAGASRARIALLDLSGRVLVDTMVGGVPVKITVVRGTAQLEPSIDFELDIAKRRLEHLAVTMKGTLTVNVDVKVEVGGTATLQQEIDLSGPGANLYTYPFVFPLPTPIGPLPVAGTLEVDAFAGFVAKVTAGGSITTGFQGSSAFAVRASFDEGKWTVENQPSFDGMLHPPQLQALLASELRAYVRPEVRARFYGVAGPRASVAPSLKAAVTVVPPAAPAVTLEGCITGQVGFDAKLFGIDLLDLAHDFPEVCRPLPLL